MQKTSFEPLIHRRFLSFYLEEPIERAARAMKDKHAGYTLIHDSSGNLAGILTDRDIACLAVGSGESGQAPVSRFMSPEPVTIEEGDSLQALCELMERYAIRRVPVVSVDPKSGLRGCVGVVSLDDLIASQWVDERVISRIVKRQLGPSSFFDRSQVRRLVPSKKGYVSQVFETRETSQRGMAHQEQTYGELIHKIERMVSPTIVREKVPSFVRRVLGALVQRMTPSAAMNFISQLPMKIQQPLIDLPSGPIRDLTFDRFAQELVREFEISGPFDAKTQVEKLLSVVYQAISPQEYLKLESQLPKDWKEILTEASQLSAA